MTFKIIGIATVFLATVFLGHNSFADEIEMTCTFKHKDFYSGKHQTKRLKYENPFFSQKRVLSFRDGKWQDWCRPLPTHHKPCKISITEKSALMVGYLKDKLSKDNFGKKEGYDLIKVIKYNLNFDPPRLHIDTHYETYSGQRLFKKIKDWERWSCKLT